MPVNLLHLSHSTLCSIVADLDEHQEDLKTENEKLSVDLANEREEYQRASEQTNEWERKFFDAQEQNTRAMAQASGQYGFGSHEQQVKNGVCQAMLDATHGLTDDQALVVCGLVAEAGLKIHAIKTWRGRTGDGLKESKETVEQWRAKSVPKNNW